MNIYSILSICSIFLSQHLYAMHEHKHNGRHAHGHHGHRHRHPRHGHEGKEPRYHYRSLGTSESLAATPHAGQAALIQYQHPHRTHGIKGPRRHHRRHSSWKAAGKTGPEVYEISKQQFIKLQQPLGILTPVQDMQPLTVRGQQPGGQWHFNKLRLVLNEALSQPFLTAKDIEFIESKITRLTQLKPGRWPRAEQYKALLEAKIQAQAQLPPQEQELLTHLSALADILDDLDQQLRS